MILRSDHVAGGFFVIVGIVVYFLSTDLPTGALSMPGAGMLPKLVTGLMIFFGLLLIVRGSDSAAFAEIAWDDLRHAVPVLAIAALAVVAFRWLGFIVTMSLMLFALTAGIERRNLARAGAFSLGVTLATWALFSLLLKTPLEPGIWRF